MATIQRNVKTFGNRNFVAEVASAPSNYAPILANEVDKDLDDIYAAWNGGTDTVNLKDGSVTFAKLAADAQLWRDTGTALTPGTNFAARPAVIILGDATMATVTLGNATARGRVQAFSTGTNIGGVGLLTNRYWATNAQDDVAKPSWGLILAQDAMFVQRSPAGSTTQTNLLTLDATGQLILAQPGTTSRAHFYQGSNSNLYISNNYQIVGTVLDDATQPSWVVQLGGTGADQFLVRRAAPGATAFANPVIVSAVGDLTITGAVATKASGTAWVAASDRRIKKNITDYAAGLDQILALRPIRFEYNGLGGTQDGLVSYGLIADEVEPVMPEMVGAQSRKLNPDDEEEIDLQTLDTTALPLALVGAVKELAARVAALEGAAA